MGETAAAAACALEVDLCSGCRIGPGRRMLTACFLALLSSAAAFNLVSFEVPLINTCVSGAPGGGGSCAGLGHLAQGPGRNLLRCREQRRGSGWVLQAVLRVARPRHHPGHSNHVSLPLAFPAAWSACPHALTFLPSITPGAVPFIRKRNQNKNIWGNFLRFTLAGS